MRIKKSQEKQQYVNFSRLGIIFLVLGAASYALLPHIFALTLCANGCGYANLDGVGYVIFIAAPLFILGLVLSAIGYFVKR